MFQASLEQKIEQELARGEEARLRGYEGRARVCARRAAGIAIRAFLEAQGSAPGSATAYDLLAILSTEAQVSERARAAANSLLERVNESYELSSGADLLAEARALIAELRKTGK